MCYQIKLFCMLVHETSSIWHHAYIQNQIAHKHFWMHHRSNRKPQRFTFHLLSFRQEAAEDHTCACKHVSNSPIASITSLYEACVSRSKPTTVRTTPVRKPTLNLPSWFPSVGTHKCRSNLSWWNLIICLVVYFIT